MAQLRILVTGATGFLGGFAVDAVRRAGHVPSTTARSGGDAAVDLAAPGMVDAVLEALRPDRVLHLAAMARLADCKLHPDRALAVNAAVPGRFAERLGDRLLHASTDLVFDGRAAPYAEDAAPSPLSAYGRSKAEGEQRVLAAGGRVARLPLLFGPDERGRGASASLRAALDGGQTVSLFTNEYRSPLHAADAAAGLVELLVRPPATNLVHLPGPERVSRWEFGRRLCQRHGIDTGRLRAVECDDAERPKDVALVGIWGAGRSLAAMLADA
jgi:dTDP-4-dehydrorhamnose reductase